MLKNVNIFEFGDYIWNHHEKCITNKYKHAWYGLEICEISENFEKQNDFVG